MTVSLDSFEKYEDYILYDANRNFSVHRGDNCLVFKSGDPGNLLERYPDNTRRYADYILSEEDGDKLLTLIGNSKDPVEALRDYFNEPYSYLKLEKICKENGIHLRIVLTYETKI